MPGGNRLATEAWDALSRAHGTIARELEQAAHWDEIPPREFGVLQALGAADDGLRISDLLDDVLLSQPGCSRLVARMEERGLVERRQDRDDARASRFYLTSSGSEIRRRVARVHAEHVATVMKRALSPEQLETLKELSRALLAAPECHRP